MRSSVIVTTYNKPEALGKVLEGIREETLMPHEVIIADDGSGPQTLKKVREFSPGSAYRLYHIWQEDLGFRAARIRNKAIKKATGEYIILLDGDCIPPRHFIEDHVALAKEGFFVQGKRVLVSKRLSPRFSYVEANSSLRLLAALISKDISNAHHLIRLTGFPALRSRELSGIKSCNMGFFKKDIVAVNGFNQDFVGWGREDSELAVRFFRYGLCRKTHPFMAICFHLWHKEHDRTKLDINDQILRKTIESNDYFCSNGLVQSQENHIR